MTTRRTFAIEEFFPQPKEVTLTSGNSELSCDIRLVTSNVLPLQRKAIRSVLTAAGVKVVANKKRYVVEARIESAENFDLSRVPECAQQEYYEITIQDSEIYIRSPYQDGSVWASQTLAKIYKRFQRGLPIPNMVIKDWPSTRYRGMAISNTITADRMSLPDWFLAIDSAAEHKLNTIEVCLAGNSGDSLMVAVPEQEDIHTQRYARWYIPNHDDIKEETYQPLVFSNSFFGDIVTYGRERGIVIVPAMTSRAYFPAKAPLSKEVLANVKAFLATLLDTYYPTGCEAFKIDFNDIANAPKADATTYAKALIACLVEKNVHTIILPAAPVVTPAFLTAIRTGAESTSFILETPVETPAAALKTLQKTGLPIWFTASSNLQWNTFFTAHDVVETAVLATLKNNLAGLVITDIHKPEMIDHIALLGAWLWNGHEKQNALLDDWMTVHFANNAADVLALFASLQKMTANTTYKTAVKGQADAASYPLENLLALEKKGKASADALEKLVAESEKNDILLAALLERERLAENERDLLKALCAENQRIYINAYATSQLLLLRKELSPAAAIRKTTAVTVKQLRENLRPHFLIFNAHCPFSMIPTQCGSMTRLFEFIDALGQQLMDFVGRRKFKDIRWTGRS